MLVSSAGRVAVGHRTLSRPRASGGRVSAAGEASGLSKRLGPNQPAFLGIDRRNFFSLEIAGHDNLQHLQVVAVRNLSMGDGGRLMRV